MNDTRLRTTIQQAVRLAGDPTSIKALLPVAGGCINNAQQVVTAQRSYLFKYNTQQLPRMFSAEAQGLALLRHTRTLRVPEVFAQADAADGQAGWMLQEWIAPFRGDTHACAARLGAGLAALHRAAAGAQYGLDHDNYIGFTPQLNRWHGDWTHFYRDRRLGPQIALADRNGWLTSEQRARFERLLDRLDDWLGGVERQPALLHGDLWGGNVLYDTTGQPVIIDPAVFYGDRETELAYGEWFGSFPPAMYSAYDETWPTPRDRADRRDLYILYHALNHLNHFGTRYLGEVERILRRYVG